MCQSFWFDNKLYHTNLSDGELGSSDRGIIIHITIQTFNFRYLEQFDCYFSYSQPFRIKCRNFL